jgi:hypothetical protein
MYTGTTPDGATFYSNQAISISTYANPWSSASLTEFTVVKTVSGTDKSGKFTVSGSEMNTWQNLSGTGTRETMIQANTTLNRIRTVSKTRNSDGQYVKVAAYTGTPTDTAATAPTGVSALACTYYTSLNAAYDGGDTSGKCNSLLTFTAVPTSFTIGVTATSTYTMQIAEEQLGYASSTATTPSFDHVIYSTGLTISDDLATDASYNGVPTTRTISAGSISVYHALKGLTMTTTYSASTPLVISVSTGLPVSGTMSFSVVNTSGASSNDQYVGSGTITVSNGVYTYTFTPSASGSTEESGDLAVTASAN